MQSELNQSRDILSPSTKKPVVMFVDDEPSVLKAMQRFARDFDWQVLVAHSGSEAIELMKNTAVDVVVSDMRMPGMSGDVFLRKVKDQSPETLRVLLTGHADLKSLKSAINNAGVYSYLNKPWDDHMLADVINGAIQLQASERERMRLEALTRKQNRQLGRLALSLDKTVKERTIEIEQALTLLTLTHEQSKASFTNALAVVTHLLDWSEGRANNHCRFVAEWSAKVAKALHYSKEDCELAQTAGLLHDIGLMALPENVRRKPVFDLNADELDSYQQHPMFGEIALSSAPNLEALAKVVKQHHEYLDGTGFPDGLRSSAIHPVTKIITVVADYHDLFHGMLIKHCLGGSDAKRYLQKHRQSIYCDKVVDAFLALLGNSYQQQVYRFKASLGQLKPGMRLEEDLYAKNKLLLLTRGSEITQGIIDRLAGYEYKFSCRFELMVEACADHIENADEGGSI